MRWSFNIFLGFLKLINSVIIRKGEKLPTKASRSFFTIVEGQTKVACRVTECEIEEIDPEHVTILNDDEASELALPPNRPAGQEIKVTYEYQIDQTVRCYFEDVATGLKKEFVISPTRNAGSHSSVKKFTVE
jgi:molecular chaperone DnaK